MRAWYGDTGGRVQCAKTMTEVTGGQDYYDEIRNKCDGRYQCDNLDVRVGGSMWCPGTLFNADTIDTVTIQYRCLRPPPGTV